MEKIGIGETLCKYCVFNYKILNHKKEEMYPICVAHNMPVPDDFIYICSEYSTDPKKFKICQYCGNLGYYKITKTVFCLLTDDDTLLSETCKDFTTEIHDKNGWG